MNRLRTRLRASIASGPLVLLDFISGGLDPRITFSRGSNATLVDSTGKITYAPANLLLQSQTFDNASWSKTAVTVTANTAVAPDGTSTADAIIATAAAAIHSASQDSTLDGNIPVTFSVYVKAAGYTTGALRFEALSAPFNSLRLAFDLSAGTVTPVAYLGAVVLGSSISNVGNGWFRVSITGTTGFSGAHRSYVFPSTGASFTGDGTSGIFIWGAQLEPVTYQTTPSTYVATTTAAYYGPRFDYDPVTLAAKGLLIEEQRTNLALYSEQFDNAAWTKGDTAVTANATTAPSGATTADLLTETATTNFHFVLQAVTTAAGAATATVYAKLASGSRNLVVYPQGTTVGYAIFNLSTGAITASGGGALLSSSITPAGNGWYRCSVSWTASATSTNFVCYLTNSTTNPAPNYAGDGTSGVFIWGAQLEAGAFATSYIPTVASTVTRSADVATMTGTNFSSWYNQSEGTFVAGADSYLVDTSTRSILTVYASGTPANNIRILNTDNRQLQVNNSGNQVDLDGGTPTANVVSNVAAAYKVNDFALSLNGGTAVTDTSGTIPTVNTLAIGAGEFDNTRINGHIRSIAYYNTRLTNTELQTLTAPSLTTTLTMSFTNQAYTVGV